MNSARPTPDGLHACVGILHNGQLSKGCFSDAIISIKVKNNLLVVSEEGEGFVDNHYYKDQYAFEMLDGRFT
ncbi:hypothetical protein [Helicobacter salomonis]|uniref:hypothetical protein n=1 Tax=Helicobacter salomonis TaxID=56878 RepID=UPI0013152083|nr:hypothetical protein [Helicobacter salomonis]